MGERGDRKIMFRIEINGNICVNRGDTFEVPLSFGAAKLDSETEKPALKVGDVLTFRLVCPNSCGCRQILEKAYVVESDEEEVSFAFEHSDTTDLTPQTYYYEVKLRRPSAEEVKEDYYETLTSRRKFVVLS
jgi:hypothetical protein